jgi:predicted metal-binding protein
MKFLINLFVFSLVIIFLSACSGTSNSNSARTTKFPEGKDLYLAKCTACHRAYEPELHTKDEWQKILDEMGSKAKLSDNEKQTILNYLTERDWN